VYYMYDMTTQNTMFCIEWQYEINKHEVVHWMTGNFLSCLPLFLFIFIRLMVVSSFRTIFVFLFVGGGVLVVWRFNLAQDFPLLAEIRNYFSLLIDYLFNDTFSHFSYKVELDLVEVARVLGKKTTGVPWSIW
jgi:hypothetical protein